MTQPRWGYWQPPAPGCVPLRPLGLSDILDGSFKAIRANPKVMLGLSAAVAALQVVLVALTEYVAFDQLGKVKVTSADNPTSSTSLGPLLGTESTQLVTIVVSTLLGAVLTGMLTISVTQDVLGVRLDVRAVWQRVRPRLWRLIALAVVTTVLEIAGLFLCLVPGIWLWGVWAVAVPALVVESTTMRGALGRSLLLVSGMFWRVWGIRALGWLVTTVVAAFIAAPFAIAGAVVDSDVFSATSNAQHVPLAFVLLTAVGSALSAAFTAPVRAGIDALLYVDLRMRREGMDIALLHGIGAAPATPAAPPRTAW